jgi:hypothetical protein
MYKLQIFGFWTQAFVDSALQDLQNELAKWNLYDNLTQLIEHCAISKALLGRLNLVCHRSESLPYPKKIPSNNRRTVLGQIRKTKSRSLWTLI